ncbi:hypothetical protein P153DRAFT_73722 [Dothidotthia symphoricarpi CBS 119687]|uniref:Uncharacterized protein n=1 Tax=Dothidotthia symphoricarpi CBS 119687 TaxID=1392245 RepID=A0A6A6A5X3_9PLEO|nr:uncharacterized protein P153DRAFT_73722 [Dothidotthia symphoricarpi CBS 119687]KAF2126946.1 hypothetical protein P153DRAFT_73722 [Dothidotthia symphoricarpi CBS 119687]
MELHLTSYKMYAAIAFETTTMSILGVLGKELLTYGKSSWKRFFRWLAIFSMFLSTLYVLSFPTLMAGYITTYEPYIEDYDNNLIELWKVVKAEYIINDASRIGFANPLVVVEDDLELMRAIREYTMRLIAETNRLVDNNTNYGDLTTWDHYTGTSVSEFRSE